MAALRGAFPGALILPARGLLGARDPATTPAWSPRHDPGLETPAQTPRGGSSRAPPGSRRKHQLQMEEAAADGCPARKRRLTAAGLEDWSLEGPPPTGSGLGLGLQAGAPFAQPGVLEPPCEDMEQVTGEQLCEAARRRFQELEDRIIEEEEEEEEDIVLVGRNAGHLPTLVLSDMLKTGLKREYDRLLPKKIVESMSRPSMELVLWKPLPDFLPDKSKAVPAKSYKPVSASCQAKPVSLLHARFPPPPEEVLEPPPGEVPSGRYGAVGPTAGAEEEMEL